MLGREDLNSDRELPAETLVERDQARVIGEVSVRLTAREKVLERRIEELREGIIRRIPAEPQTIYIDPAVGE